MVWHLLYAATCAPTSGLTYVAVDLQPQPARKADTSIEQIRPFFKYPINEASRRLGICSTSLKKICRANGLLRWPYRKVSSYPCSMGILTSASYRNSTPHWTALATQAATLSQVLPAARGARRSRAWRPRWRRSRRAARRPLPVAIAFSPRPSASAPRTRCRTFLHHPRRWHLALCPPPGCR